MSDALAQGRSSQRQTMGCAVHSAGSRTVKLMGSGRTRLAACVIGAAAMCSCGCTSDTAALALVANGLAASVVGFVRFFMDQVFQAFTV